MALLSSKQFYKRHTNEIKKHIYENKKTLIISNKDSDFLIDKTKNLDLIYIDIRKNFDIQLNESNNKYDLIVLSDIFELSDDILGVLDALKNKTNEDGRILISSINPVWNWVLILLELLNVKKKSGNRSYIHLKKFESILLGTGLEIASKKSRQYFPFHLFYFGDLLNKFFEISLYFLNFGIRNYIIIRKSNFINKKTKLSKSVIVPAKNEEGNLKELIDRIPNLGKNNEIIISCGNSQDRTFEVANSLTSEFYNIKVIKQSKDGKANAVWEALEHSSNQVIAILDADISVDPETLYDFFDLIETNKADFVNGTRLVYAMEKGSMRFLNNLGNRIFQYIITLIIRLPLTDSLCGTKVFKRELYEKIKLWQSTIKVSDPFCDFDLLFTSAFVGQKILEVPIHYRARTYGNTQIKRFKDGFRLIGYLVRSFYKFNSST
mgnify:CR=1 FL=1